MKKNCSQVVWDRRNQVCIQPPVYGQQFVRMSHKMWVGRLAYRLIISRPILSKLLAYRDFTAWSRKKIPGFLKIYDLDPKTFILPIERFRTFNDFFIRELRPESIPFDPHPDNLCSPCEAQLEIVRNIDSNDTITIKGVTFSLGRLVGKSDLARQFNGGDLCSFYLAPQYYHRFHFPIDCEWRQHWILGNRLFAVNEFSFRYGFRPFDVNVRHINSLWNPSCAEFLYIEVGATLVGRIQQCHPLPPKNSKSTPNRAKKGEPKGFFSLGGSSILMVFAKNSVDFSRDILEKNLEGLPVWLRPGETIGRLID